MGQQNQYSTLNCEALADGGVKATTVDVRKDGGMIYASTTEANNGKVTLSGGDRGIQHNGTEAITLPLGVSKEDFDTCKARLKAGPPPSP